MRCECAALGEKTAHRTAWPPLTIVLGPGSWKSGYLPLHHPVARSGVGAGRDKRKTCRDRAATLGPRDGLCF